MVNLLGNLFTCNNNKKEEKDIRNKSLVDLKNKTFLLENRLNLVEQKLSNDISRLTDKIELKFDMLNNKIDSLILQIKKT